MFDFFKTLKIKSPTKSAFVQRRKRIKPLFFQNFFLYTAKVFQHRFPVKRWKGFRLFAIDGSGLRLPDEPWLGEALGWHQNQFGKVPSVRWLVTFDVLNKIITDVQLHPRSKGEITVWAPLIEKLDADIVAIYDRGFGAYAIPFLHNLYGSNCIVRLKVNFNKTVTSFVQSGDNERIVTEHLSERGVRTIRKLGHKVSRKDTITFRLIRVNLPTGEVEVLLTTLLDQKKYHHRHFAGLYDDRWGIETNIFVLKSYFQAAVFSAYTLPGVLQDIWALFAMYNIQTMCTRSKEKEIRQINKRRKYDYQINRNVGIGLIKRFITSLFLDEIKAWNARINSLSDELIRHLEPVRPRPSRERKRKILRGTERHIYESNYKPTL